MINVKKIFATILSLSMLTGTVSYADGQNDGQSKEYELWAQAPYITSGYTEEDIRIFKALDQDEIELLPLDKVGPNYYFAICTRKMTDGGYNGKSETSEYTFYLLYATETGFIILAKYYASNEYWWDGGYSMADMSGVIDSAYYEDNDSEIPYYIISPKDKYVSSYYTIYDEYYIITNTGTLYQMKELVDRGDEGYPFVKDGILYRGQNIYKRNSSYYSTYYMDDGYTPASNSTPMFFKNGTLSYGTAVRFPVAEMTAGNGYSMYTQEFSSNIQLEKYMPIPGSDKLFFKTSNVLTEDTTDAKKYFYLKVDVYKPDNGKMKQLKTTTIPTKRTSSSAYTYNEIKDIDESYYINKGLDGIDTETPTMCLRS